MGEVIVVGLLVLGFVMFVIHKLSDREFNAEREHNERLRTKADEGKPVMEAYVSTEGNVTTESTVGSSDDDSTADISVDDIGVSANKESNADR